MVCSGMFERNTCNDVGAEYAQWDTRQLVFHAFMVQYELGASGRRFREEGLRVLYI